MFLNYKDVLGKLYGLQDDLLVWRNQNYESRRRKLSMGKSWMRGLGVCPSFVRPFIP